MDRITWDEEDDLHCTKSKCVNLGRSLSNLMILKKGLDARAEKVPKLEKEIETLKKQNVWMEQTIRELNDGIMSTEHAKTKAENECLLMADQLKHWKSKAEAFEKRATEATEHIQKANEWHDRYDATCKHAEKLLETREEIQTKFCEAAKMASAAQKRLEDTKKQNLSLKSSNDELRTKVKAFEKYSAIAINAIDELSKLVNFSSLPVHLKRHVETFQKDQVRLAFGVTDSAPNKPIETRNKSIPESFGLSLSEDEESHAESPEKTAKKKWTETVNPVVRRKSIRVRNEGASSAIRKIVEEPKKADYSFAAINNSADLRKKQLINRNEILKKPTEVSKSGTILGRKGPTVREQQAAMMKIGVKERVAQMKEKLNLEQNLSSEAQMTVNEKVAMMDAFEEDQPTTSMDQEEFIDFGLSLSPSPKKRQHERLSLSEASEDEPTPFKSPPPPQKRLSTRETPSSPAMSTRSRSSRLSESSTTSEGSRKTAPKASITRKIILETKAATSKLEKTPVKIRVTTTKNVPEETTSPVTAKSISETMDGTSTEVSAITTSTKKYPVEDQEDSETTTEKMLTGSEKTESTVTENVIDPSVEVLEAQTELLEQTITPPTNDPKVTQQESTASTTRDSEDQKNEPKIPVVLEELQRQNKKTEVFSAPPKKAEPVVDSEVDLILQGAKMSTSGKSTTEDVKNAPMTKKIPKVVDTVAETKIPEVNKIQKTTDADSEMDLILQGAATSTRHSEIPSTSAKQAAELFKKDSGANKRAADDLEMDLILQGAASTTKEAKDAVTKPSPDMSQKAATTKTEPQLKLTQEPARDVPRSSLKTPNFKKTDDLDDDNDELPPTLPGPSTRQQRMLKNLKAQTVRQEPKKKETPAVKRRMSKETKQQTEAQKEPPRKRGRPKNVVAQKSFVATRPTTSNEKFQMSECDSDEEQDNSQPSTSDVEIDVKKIQKRTRNEEKNRSSPVEEMPEPPKKTNKTSLKEERTIGKSVLAPAKNSDKQSIKKLAETMRQEPKVEKVEPKRRRKAVVVEVTEEVPFRRNARKTTVKAPKRTEDAPKAGTSTEDQQEPSEIHVEEERTPEPAVFLEVSTESDGDDEPRMRIEVEEEKEEPTLIDKAPIEKEPPKVPARKCTASDLGLDLSSDSEEEEVEKEAKMISTPNNSKPAPFVKQVKKPLVKMIDDISTIAMNPKDRRIAEKEAKRTSVPPSLAAKKFKNIKKIDEAKAQFLQALGMKQPTELVLKAMGANLEKVSRMSAVDVAAAMLEHLKHSAKSEMWGVVLLHQKNGKLEPVRNQEEENLLRCSYELTDCGDRLWPAFIKRLCLELAVQNTMTPAQAGCYIRLFTHAVAFAKDMPEDEKTKWCRNVIFVIFSKHIEHAIRSIAYALLGNSWPSFGWIITELNDRTEWSLVFRLIARKDQQLFSTVGWLLRARFDYLMLPDVKEEETNKILGSLAGKIFEQQGAEWTDGKYKINSTTSTAISSLLKLAMTGSSEVLQFTFGELKKEIKELDETLLGEEEIHSDQPLFSARKSQSERTSEANLSSLFVRMRVVVSVFSIYLQSHDTSINGAIFHAMRMVASQLHKQSKSLVDNTKKLPEDEKARLTAIVTELTSFIETFTKYHVNVANEPPPQEEEEEVA